ncbi:MAG: four helix bundle protein [Bacteroidales bacterium]|nr:four helix bundle protein [Bacteroidales bacterium]
MNEAQNAESNDDFTHKLKIAAKEAYETNYWLQLCIKSKNYPSAKYLIAQLTSIQKLLNSIICTIKKILYL